MYRFVIETRPPGSHHCQHVYYALTPATCDHDRSTRPGKAHSILYRHPVFRLGQGWKTWGTLPY